MAIVLESVDNIRELNDYLFKKIEDEVNKETLNQRLRESVGNRLDPNATPDENIRMLREDIQSSEYQNLELLLKVAEAAGYCYVPR